ncbi:hypothetical protein [Pseudomonas fluorescens]|uniref:Uncharacterized protein n=2 Tax=Pseudomonas fluorescens TaxID=294 RepID=A0A8B4I408_PSEFL|nr:hypothetical protein [Pseudomonas fluorescens]MCI4605371.1 hypothetical protein [Pseudomonas fluorescens]PQB00205.1 hypothetical protein B0A76_14245 [Pseudomonas fluorescens]RFP96736.1 hypothetical protein D0N73_07495 [Pseudomonas fluorescens]TWR48629.1 hypothetical protein FIP59_07140 [Pseudomonas fluorescens]UKJ70402.1 hypothetical protein H1Q68_07890 [Pseudomonas fluorescens]
MTSEQFAYWLQGFVELNPTLERPTPEQWKSIAEHLKTVFVKITPPVHVVGPAIAGPARQPSYEESLRQLMRKDGTSPIWPHNPILVTC